MKKVVVLDKDGTLIYATDTSLEDICQELYIKRTDRWTGENGSYGIYGR